MFLKILAHPVFPNLNFHMPMIVDLSHPLIMLRGENGSGKSTLLHSIHYALKSEQVPGYVYRLDPGKVVLGPSYLFDAEQHNPRMQLELFKGQPEMLEFLKMASHGQVMLSMFKETFPKLADGSVLLLDEPEMALSMSNQLRILKMLKELVDQKHFRIICATHSPVLIEDAGTYVIDLDQHINRNVVSTDMGIQGGEHDSMSCCGEMERLMDRGMVRNAQPYQLANGTIITDIDTEYFLVFGDERHQFVGLHYCPFCGRVLSRELWNLEKKK